MSRRVSLIVVGGLGLMLAACSSPTTGEPTPTAATGSVPSATSSSPSAQADPLASVDPCSLLTAAQMAGNGLTTKKPALLNGIRTCDFIRPAGVDLSGYTFSVDLFENKGYRNIDTGGFSGSAHSVGGRPGILVPQPDGQNCELAFQITTTSAVEIVVTTADSDMNRACTLAAQGADAVNGNLPAGM
jgi:hypothetical protein